MSSARIWGAGIAAAVVVSAGCVPREEPIEPVKVGLLVPQSSENLRQIAESWKKAAILATEQINAAGGLYNGRPLELVVADTAADADVAVDAMRTALDADVIGVVGPATSGGVGATKAMAENAQVPQISCCATSSTLTADQSNQDGWFFRTTAHDVYQAGALAYVASRGSRGPHPDYSPGGGGADIDSCTDMIVVQQDDAYGDSLAESLVGAYQDQPISYWDGDQLVPRESAAGAPVTGQVTARIKYAKDFVGSRSPTEAAVITEAQGYLRGTAAGYEDNLDIVDELSATYDFEENGGVCVVVVAFPSDGAAMFRAVDTLLNQVESDRQGIDPAFDLPRTYLGPDGLANADFAGALGALVLQVAGTTPSHAYNDSYTEFRVAYEARFSEEPPPFTSQIFDAVVLMALAVTEAGKDDGPAVREALFKVSTGGAPFEGKFFGEMANAILADQDIDYIGPSGLLDFNERGDVTSDYALWKGAQVEGSDPPLYTAAEVDYVPFEEFSGAVED